MRSRRANAFVIWWLAFALAACGGPAAPPPATAAPTRWSTPTPESVSASRFERARCPVVLPEGQVEGRTVDCGWLVVPEDRSRLPSRAIRLAVAVFHPESGAQAPVPVVYLSGGPGGSALELIRYTFDSLYAPILAGTHRDLVVFDQRGVGASRPALDCPKLQPLSLDLLDREVDGRAVSDTEAADLVVQALADCAADLRQRADLSAYHTAANAADVRDLRVTLGYAQVDLWAVSYGTRLALEVMRDDPAGVRSAVLDSVYPPDVDLIAEGPANFDRALNRLFASCAGNAICNARYPDLRAVFYDTVDRVNAAPVRHVVTDTLTGETYPIVLKGDALIGIVFRILYESEMRLLLPQWIYDASRGHYDSLIRLYSALLANQTLVSQGMTLSVQCHEEVAWSSPEELESTLARYPELAGFYAYSTQGRRVYRLCEMWGAGAAPAIENEPVVSAVPALLMAGEFDPVTPPAWGRHAAETLRNAYFFEYPTVGHGASLIGGCPLEMMLAFWRDPSAAPDAACIAKMGWPAAP